MNNVNDQLVSVQNNNQHLIENYKNEVIATMLTLFKRMEKLVNKEISTFYNEDRLLQKDKSVLMKKVKEIQTNELNKIKNRTTEDIEKLLRVEVSVYKEQLEKVFAEFSEYISIKGVDEASLKKTYNKTRITLDNGEVQTIASMWGAFFATVNVRANQSIESAYLLEKSIKELKSDVSGGHKINENQLNAIIATTIQQAYGVVTKEMNNANSHLIKGYLWNSVLDSRTSPFCAEHAGEYYLYGYPEKSTLPYEIYAPAHYRCFSDDTEIFTNSGWKYFKDLNEEDKCFSFNPEDEEEIAFVKPIKHIAYNYSGDMIHLHNKWFDTLVTPNHDLVVNKRDGYHVWGATKFVRADSLPKNDYRIPRGIMWKSGFKYGEIQLGKYKVSPEYFCTFMGYYLSEGSLTYDNKKGRWGIKISQEKYLDEFFNYLSAGPFSNIYKCKESIMIHNEPKLALYLKGFGYSSEKYVPDIIKEMPKELIEIFLDAYILGDGTTQKSSSYKDGDFKDFRKIHTSSDRMADDIGELILKVGGRPSFYLDKCGGKEVQFSNGTYVINKDVWCISWCTKVYTYSDRLKRDKVAYNSDVYCVELPKWHTIYVRRNGQPSWSGNCRTSNPPITRSYSELGIPEEALTDKQKGLLNGTSAELPSYSQWFDSQPKHIQKEILGPTRYNAWQQSSISVDKFYNNGRRLTLKELQQKQITISEEYLRYTN